MDVTERAGRDRLANGGVRGVEPAVEADLEKTAALVDRSEGAVDLPEVESDRLLAEDRLAGSRRCDDRLRMRIGARADRERVHLRQLVELSCAPDRRHPEARGHLGRR